VTEEIATDMDIAKKKGEAGSEGLRGEEANFQNCINIYCFFTEQVRHLHHCI